MRFVSIILALIGFIFLVQCQNNSSVNDKTLKPSQEELAKGFNLLETNCFSCHSPDVRGKNRIAPPMMAIKNHYKTEGITEDEFVQDIAKFVRNPAIENARLEHAIEKFGVMPKMDFTDEQLTNIGRYIYHTPLERPGWYSESYNQEKRQHKKSSQKMDEGFLEKGQRFAMQTKSVLGKNLMTSIQKFGTEGALSFCNERAITLTDSMGNALDAKIKRVSDKHRNADNFASKEALEYISKSKLALDEGKKVLGELIQKEGKTIGYYPIITNEMCLQCHGQPNVDIKPNTLAVLSELYPNDKATGYKSGELRGIWVVEME